MLIRVIVTHYPPVHHTDLCPREIIADYVMDHDDAQQRRVLGEQCRSAFEAGQCVQTFPESHSVRH